LEEYRRAKAEWPFIDAVEKAHGLLPLLLYAVGSRETELENKAGDFTQRKGESSPRFHGFGVWQRDSGSFDVDESYLKDVHRQAEDAATLLAGHHGTFGRWDAAVAAYNCGAGDVRSALDAGRPVDEPTAGHDYSADVLARRDFLVAHVPKEEDISIVDDATKKYLDDQFKAVLARVDRAVQRIGGKSNAVYNDNNVDFQRLIMAEEALAEARAARQVAEKVAAEVATIRAQLAHPNPS